MATSKAWHKVVQLRDDLKSGELSLAQFAADLYDVMMGTARPIYQDPREFFALTYPTFALRELAKDVIQRLAGQSDKSVRQLELTYGGGKTHTLIALYHLTVNPSALPKLNTVNEFIEHIGINPLPQAQVVIFPFDKLDVEKGMWVIAPDGSRRVLQQPWSVLAYQIAGDEGLAILNADNLAEERKTAPAENLITELLEIPAEKGLSTLILMDEVLMYAREKVRHDPDFLSSLVNFFQYLSQAVSKSDRCAIVASLLATDPDKSDTEGKFILNKLSAIFRRQQEESVEPVGKGDVAEVLRRRFFTPESIQNREKFPEQVLSALRGIYSLDEVSKREGQAIEERFLASYPFHPDLTEIFYTKWTNLEGFQRTRGTLRTFAMALRDAENWDNAPLIGTNIFIGHPDSNSLSESARELSNIATREEYEGKRQEWSAILLGELNKARLIQRNYASLKSRELERAVFATFLHSQPIGNRAQTRDLLLLVGDTQPDRIELLKALDEWVQKSWFLDESNTNNRDENDGLPKSWRLGSKPNLTQIHHEIMNRISKDSIEAKLMEMIESHKTLKAGIKGIHFLPNHPRDIEDTTEFHFIIFAPRHACSLDQIPDDVKRFFDWTTNEQRPRVYRNMLVAVAPSIDGIEGARTRVREYLAWEEVKTQLNKQDIDSVRQSLLSSHLTDARNRIPESIQQAYSIGLTISTKNVLIAFRINVSNDPLFANVHKSPESRIQDKPISAEALLPDGPYGIWKQGDKRLSTKDIVQLFAKNPELPKMLNPSAIFDTIRQGCKDCVLAVEAIRPNKTHRTYWGDIPDDLRLDDNDMYLLPPEHAQLTELPVELLKKGELPQLWENNQFTFQDLIDYFRGGTTIQMNKNGYEEPFTMPMASRDVLANAIENAVQKGILWLVNHPSSIYKEAIPAGVLNEHAILHSPPEDISVTDLIQSQLPNAWKNGETTASALHTSLNHKLNQLLPWYTIHKAIQDAIHAGYLEIVSGSIPCESGMAKGLQLRMREDATPLSTVSKIRKSRAILAIHEIQELGESATELFKTASDTGIRLELSIEVGDKNPPTEETIKQLNQILKQINEDLILR